MIRYYRKAAQLLFSVCGDSGLTEEQIYQVLETPMKPEHGDIAFPCFQLAKQQKKAPPQIAAELSTRLQSLLGSEFSAAENLGPYLNFRLSAMAACEIAKEVLGQKEKFGHNSSGQGKKVLIEYSSPNVAKQLHIGHFRNTILGQSLNNIYTACGYEVISVNHLGDWGSQFGLVAYGFLQYGDEKELEKAPLDYLTKLYIRMNLEAETSPEVEREARLLFKKIEEKDPELTKLWKRFCEISVQDLERIYDRLGVHFQHYIGESFYVDKLAALVQELRTKNLLVTSEGAQVVELGEGANPCLILTSDGTSLYATRDIAAAIYRQDRFHFDQCLYVVGSEQQLHFRQIFKVLELMGYEWAKQLHHVHYGLYRFKDGKFSTRKGQVILATEVLEEAKTKALALIEEKNPSLASKSEVAERVALGAVIFNDLVTDRIKDVEFDWAKVLDFEGDTGPYLLYSYARASSILRQAAAKGFSPALLKPESALASVRDAQNLMKKFGYLETSVLGAARLNKPSIIANYAIDLAKSFSTFYRNVRVLEVGAPKEEIEARLGLVFAFRIVLTNTLQLLCIRPVEEM